MLDYMLDHLLIPICDHVMDAWWIVVGFIWFSAGYDYPYISSFVDMMHVDVEHQLLTTFPLQIVRSLIVGEQMMSWTNA